MTDIMNDNITDPSNERPNALNSEASHSIGTGATLKSAADKEIGSPEFIPGVTEQVQDQYVDKAYAKYYKENNNNSVRTDIRTLAGVVAGSMITAFNTAVFIRQGGFLPGGTSGIVVLVQRIVEKFMAVQMPFSPLSLLLNFLAAMFAIKTLGKKYTMFSFLCVIIYSVMTDFIPVFYVSDDRLLLAVFGGIIGGCGFGLVLNSGACQGGSDFIAMTFSVKKGINTYNYVLAFNVVLMMISGYLFGMESALYTIIYLYVSKTVTNVLYTRYAKKTLFIITSRPQEIAADIRAKTNHTCTIFTGEGGFSGKNNQMIYLVIGGDEVNFVRRRIRAIDENAFINMLDSGMVAGNFYIRPLR